VEISNEENNQTPKENKFKKAKLIVNKFFDLGSNTFFSMKTLRLVVQALNWVPLSKQVLSLNLKIIILENHHKG